MKQLVCITCPRGCNLKIDDSGSEFKVTGNFCIRGEKFAKQELTHPTRTICSTMRTTFKDIPVIPVRVNNEFPKEKIFDVMKEINSKIIDKPVKRGDILIPNVLGLGIDVICTSDLLVRKD